MASVSESVRIDRPVGAVFEFLDDPRNHAEITPSLASVGGIEPLENGGKRVEHTYEMAGISLGGELVERAHEENERMVFEMDGDLTGQIEITFEGDGETTTVTYSADYDLPGRVLSKLAAPVIRRYNRRELSKTLANLQATLEDGN
jgi:carbon monoxide dehydrogenase subunit G